MTGGRAAAPVLLLLLAAAPLRAQEPPSHFPTCSSDSLAGAFLERMRFLLASNDAARRATLGLRAAAPEAARLVLLEPVCLAASYAYARVAHGGTGLTPPVPMAVVQAGEQYLVQLGGLAGAEVDRWEVAVFDPAFRLVGIDPAP
ncbi:MAG: hypothetical protein IPI38_08195 [Gemmatimonadetes bacterium]|nr:hypothetical protein [Gemmatimonadota bacterium]MBK7715390.1 hypothetical protein [Gemmatimonadota bacterium]MBK7923329.1 hypothetical protein [Gemmatimonadota bacterium]MBK9692629.1 hypothetical protein [Gemmatimonadota bacterium]